MVYVAAFSELLCSETAKRQVPVRDLPQVANRTIERMLYRSSLKTYSDTGIGRAQPFRAGIASTYVMKLLDLSASLGRLSPSRRAGIRRGNKSRGVPVKYFDGEHITQKGVNMKRPALFIATVLLCLGGSAVAANQKQKEQPETPQATQSSAADSTAQQPKEQTTSARPDCAGKASKHSKQERNRSGSAAESQIPQD